MTRSRFVLLFVIVAAVVAFFAFDLGRYFSLDYIKDQQAAITGFYEANPVGTALGFVAIYVAVTALSLPGAVILTLASGAIFGLLVGTVLASIASTTGATLAFLIARFLLRDTVQAKYGKRLEAINRGVERDGAFYLFGLRLVPAFPFFVINLAMGLTPIKTATFAVVSWAGMLFGTVVFVNAGTQLSQVSSLGDIASPGLIGSFVLLGIFPLIAKKVMDVIKAKRVYKGWDKPKSFDRNLVVIGGGAAGLVSAYIGAVTRAKVTLIEQHKMGGDCLNYGCVPSKAVLRSAKLLSHISRSQDFGVRAASADFDFAEIMERVQQVIRDIEPHDSPERYESMGVEVIQGRARITSPWTVEVDGRVLTTRAIVIAAGAEPLVPPIPGLDQVDYLTSDTVWNLRERPDRLVVLGGGPIGSELSQAFARLGAEVTQVEMADRIMGKEDPEVSEAVVERFRAEGIGVRTGHKGKAVELVDGQPQLLVETPAGDEERIPFDRILLALGRKARLSGYGLEELGIEADRTIVADDFLRTKYPNIYVAGDVAGPYQFTHTASHMAWYAAVNALFGQFKRFRVDYSVVPWATFTDPEVAHVGHNETSAREAGVEYEVTTYGIDDLDRAIADSEAHGMVKVLTVPGKDKILGVTIVGEHAAELLAEYTLAMRHGLGLNKIMGTIHVYPTLSEANKYAAGQWKNAHKPEGVLRWVERFHDWRRKGGGGDRPSVSEVQAREVGH
ncbi:MAG: FAD-dependent oxidoreductase [Abyssibacter sp.]|nr:bifunctional TVP38/TMEM64 family protein/FAD-dependent oxidoreductase [Abyssibacter sp.]MCK5859787.1 FAD-dependent oxidoreductase [Abyssibacter sp.]